MGGVTNNDKNADVITISWNHKSLVKSQPNTIHKRL